MAGASQDIEADNNNGAATSTPIPRGGGGGEAGGGGGGVHHPLKWTLNGVSRHVSFAPLNGVIPAEITLNSVRVLYVYGAENNP